MIDCNEWDVLNSLPTDTQRLTGKLSGKVVSRGSSAPHVYYLVTTTLPSDQQQSCM